MTKFFNKRHELDPVKHAGIPAYSVRVCQTSQNISLQAMSSKLTERRPLYREFFPRTQCLLSKPIKLKRFSQYAETCRWL